MERKSEIRQEQKEERIQQVGQGNVQQFQQQRSQFMRVQTQSTTGQGQSQPPQQPAQPQQFGQIAGTTTQQQHLQSTVHQQQFQTTQQQQQYVVQQQQVQQQQQQQQQRWQQQQQVQQQQWQQQQQVQQQHQSMQQQQVQQQQQSMQQQQVLQQQQQQRLRQPGGVPAGTPPVFEQIFKNARFAQGGVAVFEGKIRGSPRPTVQWVRKGAVLPPSQKHVMRYEENTGKVSLQINNIGPGDEGEYTCQARNNFGEAICTVFIQPESVQPQIPPQQQQILQQQQYQRQQQQFLQQQQLLQRQAQQQQIYQRQPSHPVQLQHSLSQDFKVDTFEYRILHEVEYRQIITKHIEQQNIVVQNQFAPTLTQKPRNSKLIEGSTARFTAKFNGAPPPHVTWFHNGQKLEAGNRITITTTDKESTLEIRLVLPEDSGHYTVLLENPSGCIVQSSVLAVEKLEEPESNKDLAPVFLKVPTDIQIGEGKSTKIESKLAGRPYPELNYYLNGILLQNDQTHKLQVNETGNHALLITNVGKFHHGNLVGVAKNKVGEAKFSININVIEKESLLAPKFIERFNTTNVKEGETLCLFARAIGNPVPNITWQKDGVQVRETPNLSMRTENGSSQLEIPNVSVDDSGWYQVTAINSAGSTATRARVFVEREPEYKTEPWRLTLPRPTKVIQPEKPPSPETIYLRHIERSRPKYTRQESERVYDPPVFLTPLKDVTSYEGGRGHFEAKVVPVGDPTMTVQWFWNGKPLPASSRANVTYRFGFIALDLLQLVVEDSGVFTCVVSSATGSAESSATLHVKPRSTIDQSPMHPTSLEKIQYLEDYSRYTRRESIEESYGKPHFTRELVNLGELAEGRNAHFEGSIAPGNDPNLRVEWYKDGRPITASSRINTMSNFGYVSLNILHLRAEDSGLYTCRAWNKSGEAISQAQLVVSVVKEVSTTEQSDYYQSLQEMEYRKELRTLSHIEESIESKEPPVFKTELRDQLDIREGGFAHFEARLEPVGDPFMKIQWLKDGKTVDASSRITSFYNFGYVALTIKQLTRNDAGTYSCIATNNNGRAVSQARLTIQEVKRVIETSETETIQKLQYLEDKYKKTRVEEVEETVTAPKFTQELKYTKVLKEGQRAHFETRLEPMSDPTMQIQWYHNGQPIQSANRISTYYDFGYVAMDISNVRSTDSGEYTVVAKNAMGQAYQQGVMNVEIDKSIDTRALHHVSERADYKASKMEVETEYCKSKPYWTQSLSPQVTTHEYGTVHLECRLEPVGDPTMKIEWYKDGRPLTVGSRFRTYYDFGYVALDISQVTNLDTGVYTVRAINKLGEAVSSSNVLVTSKQVDQSTLAEGALETLQYLEDTTRYARQEEQEVEFRQVPNFTKQLKNHNTIELSNVHLEARLSPVGDPNMRVEWYKNGQPIPVGHRYRPSYEFDYVALDILSTYTTDSGIYTCRAVNLMGEASTSCCLKVISRQEAELGGEFTSTGLEKFQYLEDTSRYSKSATMEQEVFTRPKFLTTPKPVTLKESGTAHFECKLEPVADPNLTVQWFKDGHPLTIGSRFRPIHDFGYVAIDIGQCIPEDSGIYTCQASNLAGQDQVQVELHCKSSKSILTDKQVETVALDRLEQKKGVKREFVEEVTTQVPIFTTSLKNVNIKEGHRAHFEARLIPVSDPTMVVEWFKDGIPLKSGSRFTATESFGFVALDIQQCTVDDIGEYTCRATNAIGEAITSAGLYVQSTTPLQLSTLNETSLAQIHQLENRHYRRKEASEPIHTAPLFTQPLKDAYKYENQPVHLEARLIPVGDPKLKVQWFRNQDS